MSKKEHDGFGAFENAIVEDDGELSLDLEGGRFDADDVLRLTMSQVEALGEYDRVVAMTKGGKKIVIDSAPEYGNWTPVEIRNEDSDE